MDVSQLTPDVLKKVMDMASNLDALSDQVIKLQESINTKQALVDELTTTSQNLEAKIEDLKTQQADADKITNEDLWQRSKACADKEAAQKACHDALLVREKAVAEAESENMGYAGENASLKGLLDDIQKKLEAQKEAQAQREEGLNTRELALIQREDDAVARVKDMDDMDAEQTARRSALDAEAAAQKDTQARLDAQETALNDRDVVNTQKASSLQEIADNLKARESALSAAEDQLVKDQDSVKAAQGAVDQGTKNLELGWLKINKANQDKQLGLDLSALQK